MTVAEKVRSLEKTSVSVSDGISEYICYVRSVKSPEQTDHSCRPEGHLIFPTVEQKIRDVSSLIKDRKLSWLFTNCYPNTLDRTIADFTVVDNKPYTFLITGDIPAMWLRDSTNQMLPYSDLAKHDEKLQQVFLGVINKQAEFILRDPYANAFADDNTLQLEHITDRTDMKRGVFERKWEVDSLCAPIHLAYSYWQNTGDASFMDHNWQEAMQTILRTFTVQQRMDGDNGPYSFVRDSTSPREIVSNSGYGSETKKIGLIHATHRPSDDACIYPFNIPGNFYAVMTLRELAQMQTEVLKNDIFAQQCLSMADTIDNAIKQYGSITDPKFGTIYAYEIDGLGHQTPPGMDDANMGLLSLPMFDQKFLMDPIYQNTRKAVLSLGNEYYHEGKFAKGLGSPHTQDGLRNGVWHLGIIERALTSLYFHQSSLKISEEEEHAEQEIRNALRMLVRTDAGTGFLHEAFDPDNPSVFTRPWFAWPNGLFGKLIVKLSESEDGRNLLREEYSI